MSNKREMRRKRHLRVRRKIEGTPERPRLNVYRSLKNIYAQVIDDTSGETLVAASTREARFAAGAAIGWKQGSG